MLSAATRMPERDKLAARAAAPLLLHSFPPETIGDKCTFVAATFNLPSNNR